MRAGLWKVLAVLALAGAAAAMTAVWTGTGAARPTAAAEADAAAPWPPKRGWKTGTAACRVRGRTTVGFTIPIADPAYLTMPNVLRRALRRSNINLITAVTQQPNPGKQITDIDSMVSRGARILIVAATDPVAIQPALQRARARGVKIVVTDVFVGRGYVTNVATSPFDAGFQAARFLRERIGTGQVGSIEGPTFAGPVLTARNQGFRAGANRSDLNVVDYQTNNTFIDVGARQIADAWRVRHPQMRGIFGFNDATAAGAASARAGSFQPVVVGINGDPRVIAAIRARQIAATWDLQPVLIGRALALGVETARCNRRLPALIRVPVKRIDAANARRWVPWNTDARKVVNVRLTRVGTRTVVSAR